jgi:hypothetical protein
MEGFCRGLEQAQVTALSCAGTPDRFSLLPSGARGARNARPGAEAIGNSRAGLEEDG